MKFGRASELGDLGLPDDDPRTLDVLGRAPRGPLAAHAGCPTWANKEWRGSVYPADATDLLVAYGHAFNGMELNVTHYRVPDEATVRRWRDSVPADFRFAAKVPQAASHEGDLGAAARFVENLRGLGDRLGCLFLQMAPGFGPSSADELRALIETLRAPPALPLAVELRHPRWFSKNTLTTQAWELLSAAGAAAVITDAPGRRDVLHTSLPIPVAFVRFLATTDDAVDHQRLDAWAGRMARWRDAGLRELYVWLHAPDNIGSPALVTAFRERFERATGQTLRTAVLPRGQLSLL